MSVWLTLKPNSKQYFLHTKKFASNIYLEMRLRCKNAKKMLGIRSLIIFVFRLCLKSVKEHIFSVFQNSGVRNEFLNSWYLQKEGYFFNHPCVFLPSCKFGSSFEYFTYMMMMSNRLLQNCYILKVDIAI